MKYLIAAGFILISFNSMANNDQLKKNQIFLSKHRNRLRLRMISLTRRLKMAIRHRGI